MIFGATREAPQTNKLSILSPSESSDVKIIAIHGNSAKIVSFDSENAFNVKKLKGIHVYLYFYTYFSFLSQRSKVFVRYLVILSVMMQWREII